MTDKRAYTWPALEPLPATRLCICRVCRICRIYIYTYIYIYKRWRTDCPFNGQKVYLANIWQRCCVSLFIHFFFPQLNVFELTFWHFGIANFDSVPGGGDVSSVSACPGQEAAYGDSWTSALMAHSLQQEGIWRPRGKANHLHTTEPVGHFNVDLLLYNHDDSESAGQIVR